jgi:hypothetical protein
VLVGRLTLLLPVCFLLETRMSLGRELRQFRVGGVAGLTLCR